MPMGSCLPRLFSATLAVAACSAADDIGLPPDAGGDAPGSPVDAADAASAVFVDSRDDQSYPTISIGDQTWLARNLDYDIAGSSFCYDDEAANCEADGRLYLWSVAPTACPPGSHLGSDDEWKDLETAVGMASNQLDLEGYAVVRGTDEGTTLKASDGFAARMAGYRTGTTYDALDDRTYFWTDTLPATNVWRRRIEAATPTVFRFTNAPEGFAISVRCILD